MDVTFETGTKKFTIEVGYFDTILEMKEKIEKYEGFPVARQTLIFKGNVMVDDRDTEFYQVLQGSRIRLLLDSDPLQLQQQTQHPAVVKIEEGEPTQSSSRARVLVNIPAASANTPKRMQLTVRPQEGTPKITVEVNASDTVSELRKELQRLHGGLRFPLPANGGFFFIWKQKVLDERMSFHDHKVMPGDTIEVFGGSVTGGS